MKITDVNSKCEIKLELQQSPSLDNKVFINGEQIHGVRAVSLTHGINCIPVVTIEIIPQTVEVTCLGDARMKFSELKL